VARAARTMNTRARCACCKLRLTITMNLLQLKRLATNRSFARGEVYLKDGHVRSLTTHEEVITAIVSGQHDYCVRLRSGGDEIEYSCDCPIGLEGEFCKHLVAAGLSLIDSDAESKSKTGSEGKRESTGDKIHTFLEQQDKNTLIAMLKREAMESRDLLRCASNTNASATSLSCLRESKDSDP
jgi:uncharacterized Zn finger protein